MKKPQITAHCILWSVRSVKVQSLLKHEADIQHEQCMWHLCHEEEYLVWERSCPVQLTARMLFLSRFRSGCWLILILLRLISHSQWSLIRWNSQWSEDQVKIVIWEGLCEFRWRKSPSGELIFLPEYLSLCHAEEVNICCAAIKALIALIP